MKSFFEFIRDADASLELKLSLPIDDKGMETFLRQKVIANNKIRTDLLKKKSANKTARPVTR
jgi:hypothetical protein